MAKKKAEQATPLTENGNKISQSLKPSKAPVSLPQGASVSFEEYDAKVKELVQKLLITK